MQLNSSYCLLRRIYGLSLAATCALFRGDGCDLCHLFSALFIYPGAVLGRDISEPATTEKSQHSTDDQDLFKAEGLASCFQ